MFSLQFCDGGFDHGLCFGHDGLILGDQAGHGLTHAAKIKDENLVSFDSAAQAQAAGYAPCGACKP